MIEAGETYSKRRTLRVGGAVAVLFLLLLAWQAFSAYRAGQERDEVERELAFQQMGTDLAMAVIESSYGSYEGARELMSSVFTRLQQNIHRAPPEGRERMGLVLDQRDAVITALSRRDPESPEILARLFFQFRDALGEPERTELIPAPGPQESPADTVDR